MSGQTLKFTAKFRHIALLGASLILAAAVSAQAPPDGQKVYQTRCATVDQVPGKGGALDGAGAAVAGGMVFVNSGYGYNYEMPGNVLLAFAVE